MSEADFSDGRSAAKFNRRSFLQRGLGDRLTEKLTNESQGGIMAALLNCALFDWLER